MDRVLLFLRRVRGVQVLQAVHLAQVVQVKDCQYRQDYYQDSDILRLSMKEKITLDRSLVGQLSLRHLHDWHVFQI